MSDINTLRKFGYVVVYERPNYRVTAPGDSPKLVGARGLLDVVIGAREKHRSQFKFPDANRSYRRAPKYGPVEVEVIDGHPYAVLWREDERSRRSPARSVAASTSTALATVIESRIVPTR